MRIEVQGKPYVVRLGIIHTKLEDGSPGLVKFIRDTDSIELNGGEEFLTAFIPDIDWSK